jgi:acyl carrier protein
MTAVETALALKAAGQLVVSTGDLQARIRQWINLESFDRTSGKDPQAAGKLASPAGDAAGPTLRMDLLVTQVWQRVLGLEQIGLEENFFDLGGHSLLLIKAHGELRQALKRDLSLISLFQHPTIASLAAYLEAENNGAPPADDVQTRAERQRLAASRRRSVVRS